MSMKETERNYEPYILAITEQVEQHLAGLDELSDLAAHRPLTFNERSASERSLQVIVEAAIGCSKHYLKSQNKPVPSEARASIESAFFVTRRSFSSEVTTACASEWAVAPESASAVVPL